MILKEKFSENKFCKETLKELLKGGNQEDMAQTYFET